MDGKAGLDIRPVNRQINKQNLLDASDSYIFIFIYLSIFCNNMRTKKFCSTWVKTMFVLVDEHRSIIRSMYLFRRSLSIPLT